MRWSSSPVALVALSAGLLTACGNDGPRPPVPAATAPAGHQTARVTWARRQEAPGAVAGRRGGASGLDPKNNCAARGIDRRHLKEGVCQTQGRTVKVVNRGSTLTLDELDARFRGYATAKSLVADTGTAAARGTFVILDLAVTNRLTRPAALDPDQVVLRLAGRTFTHDFEAMNMPGRSFVWNARAIAPGRTRTGTAIFDVPTSAVGHLRTDGKVVVAQFSDAAAVDPAAAGRTLGFFRTFH